MRFRIILFVCKKCANVLMFGVNSESLRKLRNLRDWRTGCGRHNYFGSLIKSNTEIESCHWLYGTTFYCGCAKLRKLLTRISKNGHRQPRMDLIPLGLGFIWAAGGAWCWGCWPARAWRRGRPALCWGTWWGGRRPAAGTRAPRETRTRAGRPLYACGWIYRSDDCRPRDGTVDQKKIF